MAQSKEEKSKQEDMFLIGCISKAKEALLNDADSKTQTREFKKYADEFIAKLKKKKHEN